MSPTEKVVVVCITAAANVPNLGESVIVASFCYRVRYPRSASCVLAGGPSAHRRDFSLPSVSDRQGVDQIELSSTRL